MYYAVCWRVLGACRCASYIHKTLNPSFVCGKQLMARLYRWKDVSLKQRFSQHCINFRLYEHTKSLYTCINYNLQPWTSNKLLVISFDCRMPSLPGCRKVWRARQTVNMHQIQIRNARTVSIVIRSKDKKIFWQIALCIFTNKQLNLLKTICFVTHWTVQLSLLIVFKTENYRWQ